MRIWRGLESFTEPFDSCTLAIGVFDGIHLGHQELIRKAIEDARSHGRRVLMKDRRPDLYSDWLA